MTDTTYAEMATRNPKDEANALAANRPLSLEAD